jgi:hypothetical protein
MVSPDSTGETCERSGEAGCGRRSVRAGRRLRRIERRGPRCVRGRRQPRPRPEAGLAVGKDDAYEISLTDPDGQPIKNLAAGAYDVKVEDLSSIHDFHLTGSGVSESTTVGEKVEKTWHVTFAPGDYSFVCDPHSSSMSGDFHVT